MEDRFTGAWFRKRERTNVRRRVRTALRRSTSQRMLTRTDNALAACQDLLVSHACIWGLAYPLLLREAGPPRVDLQHTAAASSWQHQSILSELDGAARDIASVTGHRSPPEAVAATVRRLQRACARRGRARGTGRGDVESGPPGLEEDHTSGHRAACHRPRMPGATSSSCMTGMHAPRRRFRSSSPSWLAAATPSSPSPSCSPGVGEPGPAWSTTTARGF